jgi:chromosome partitioning protein
MIVSIASFKGGVGKTMTAIHVAAYLSQLAPTILIDYDPNQSAFDWSKRGSVPFTVITDDSNAESKDYKHVVFDTEPRTTSDDLIHLAEISDLLIIPSPPDAVSLEVLAKTIDALKTMKANNYKVLLTVIPPKPNRDGEEARSYLESLQIPVFVAEIHRYIAYSKASLEGVTVQVIDDQRASIAWQEYVELGKEIIDYDR